MRRGRPPYPDLLTPREQEVLALLRDGLTNQQIADRLGISLYGARYHVSEILSKLGVEKREDAARWQQQTARRWPALGLAWLSWKRVAIVGAGLASAGVALVLAVLLFRDTSMELGKVAFIRDGSLWVKDLPDGPERQLTFKAGAFAPQWSPTGEWILYYQGPPSLPQDIGLFVVRADGSDKRRLETSIASWSPIADVLALSLEDSSLVTENADGTGRRKVLSPIPGRDFNPLDRRLKPLWSSDGQWIVFEEHHADRERAATYAYIGLRAVRIDGSDEHELFSFAITPEGFIGDLSPVISDTAWDIGLPAFVWLTAATGTSPSEVDAIPLRLMALEALSGLQPGATDAMATLTLQTEPGVPMLLFRDFFALSPDGKALAVVVGVALQDVGIPADRSVPVDTQTDKGIALMDLRTGEVTPLFSPDMVAVSPTWSPDGEIIAFVARTDTGPVQAPTLEGDATAEQLRRLWTMRLDGSDAEPLDVDGADCRHERPQWSRDGRQLLFACLSGPEAEDASLWVIPSRGGRPRQVVEEVSLLVTSGPLPAFASRYGHISWPDVYDWWQP